MTKQEKQREYAQCLYVRGIITSEQANKIISAKFSYDVVETMIDLAAGIVNADSGRAILMRMVK